VSELHRVKFTRYSPRNIVPNYFIDNLNEYHRTKFDIRITQWFFFSFFPYLPNIKFCHCVHRSQYEVQTSSYLNVPSKWVIQ
jgi:hypothetical protein